MIELQFVWGWQPALYLFLGGLGAGTFIVAGFVDLATSAYKRVTCVAMWCSIVFLAVGLGLLVLELSAPLRALMMWQSFSNLGSSWMAIGAWLLFAAIISCGVAAICNTALITRLLGWKETTFARLGRICTVVGIILALCVAAYTGVLLMKAPGVPFWNTLLLPVLFSVSALDTGVAFVAILMAVLEPSQHRVPQVLERATICLIVAEVVVLAVFVGAMATGVNPLFDSIEPGYAQTAAASANAWLSGQLSVAFWGLLVVCGLAVPFALAITQVSKLLTGRAVAITGAVCVLVGGCTLRFITLLAGIHVDIVATAVTTLL